MNSYTLEMDYTMYSLYVIIIIPANSCALEVN